VGKYRVAFSRRAVKDLDVLSRKEFNRIIEGCRRLEDAPHPDGKHIKKLKGHEDLYRLRVGEYRIIFEWKGEEINIVTVLTRQDFGKRY
jgi:mRNA interferase RelE/StbE